MYLSTRIIAEIYTGNFEFIWFRTGGYLCDRRLGMNLRTNKIEILLCDVICHVMIVPNMISL